jgi:NCS1 family nucleobase:cation symporter-1
LLLNSHVGAKYGIPFPVFARASFGTFGANVPALMRAIVACGWFGIETWLGGFAIYTLLFVVLLRSPDPPGQVDWFMLPGPRQMAMFALFWLLQVWLAIVAPPWKGSRAIKLLFHWSAPFLLAFTTALFLYEGARIGFDKLFSVQLQPDRPQAASFYFWWLLLNINVGFWATMALNIPDLTRFARDQARQMMGQATGLIGTMGYFSLMGVLVTQGGTVLYSQTARDTANQAGTSNDIWNPINLFALLANDLGIVLVVLALLFVVLAQLSTNIGANIVAPANDFQNVNPRRLTWAWGVLLTALIGVLLQPWVLFFNAMNYAVIWLSGYGGFLGAIGGVMVADYWLLRKRCLNLADLYHPEGVYRYGNRWGVNRSAIAALLAGMIPPFLGWLHVILSTPPSAGTQPILPGGLFAGYSGSVLDWIQTGSWFFSFPVALVVYAALMKTVGKHHLTAQMAAQVEQLRAPAV